MFESKLNRGRANGYAPLDGSGKVPLDKLPPIQSTIDTGSFATTGSNTFIGNQTISGSLYFGSGSSIYKTTDASIIVGKQSENVQIFAADTSGSFWRLFVLYSLYPNIGTKFTAGNTVTTDWGTPVTTTIQEVIDDTEINGKWVFIFDENVITGFNGGPQTATFGEGLQTWTFGDDGIFKLNNGIAEIYADTDNGSVRIGNAGPNVAPNAQIIIGGDNTLKIKSGPPLREWNFDGYGNLTSPGNINVSGSVNISSSLVVSSTFVNNANLQLSGSDLIVDEGNLYVTGDINVTGSLIVSSTVINNGTIGALNSDLIIDGGYLILTGSIIPTASTGSIGDIQGMIVTDNNFLYYCVSDYISGSEDIWKRIAFESGSW